jgi:hypothetical protein
MLEINEKYSVYVHVLPNGKKYYGITRTDPEKRWQNGTGYKRQKRLFSAISRFGWNSITHIVLLTNLGQRAAEAAEIFLIANNNTHKSKYGYNQDLGGKHIGKVSEETRRKMSLVKRGIRPTATARINMSIAQRNRKASAETKAKISAAGRGRRMSEELKEKLRKINTGRKQSLETREKIRLANLGKHPTPETLEKLRIGRTGRKVSPETKMKISLAQKGIPRKPMTPEHKARLLTMNTGKIVSVETRLKMGLAQRKRTATEETRARQSAAKLGKIHSTETRIKMSLAHRKRAYLRKGNSHYEKGQHEQEKNNCVQSPTRESDCASTMSAPDAETPSRKDGGRENAVHTA